MRKIDFSRMPDALSDSDTIWQFMTPLHEAQGRLLVEQFMETTNVLAVAMQAGATASPIIINRALRDAVRGVGGPATWRKATREQDAEAEGNQQQADMMQTVQQVGAAGAAGEQVGAAGQALGLIAPPAPGGGAGAPPPIQPGAGGPPAGGAQRALPPPPGGGGDIGAALAALGA